MDINEDLLKRFFRKECTPEEASMVAAFLKEAPGFMDMHFNQDEFDAIEITADQDEVVLQQWEELQRIIRGKRVKRNSIRLAAAACMAGLLVTAALLFNKAHPGNNQPGRSIAVVNEPSDGWKSFVNNTDSLIAMVLADSSRVTLSPGSSLRYNERAWLSQRDIKLEGEATFYVAKDKKRPFTVYCHEVLVKALGTIFSVRQDNGPDSLRVRLFEGKVLVRKQRRTSQQDSADVISPVTLRPGQEILFASGQDKSLVRNFMYTAPKEMVARRQANTTNGNTTMVGWLEFKNQPLPDLFVSLEVLYNVEISYRPRDLKGVYFVGRFESYDTIDGILKIIGRLNGLSIGKTGPGKFRVQKMLAGTERMIN
jgi:transmembrane sensor